MILFYYNLINYIQANRDKWMTIPDMGYAIANPYNVILVCLLSVQNLTIFPLRTSPPISQSQHRLICIGHVYSSHFVQVYMFIYIIFMKNFISLLTNCVFTGSSTGRLSITDSGYHII